MVLQKQEAMVGQWSRPSFFSDGIYALFLESRLGTSQGFWEDRDLDLFDHKDRGPERSHEPKSKGESSHFHGNVISKWIVKDSVNLSILFPTSLEE